MQVLCHSIKQDILAGYLICFSKKRCKSSPLKLRAIIFPSPSIRKLLGIDLILYVFAPSESHPPRSET